MLSPDTLPVVSVTTGVNTHFRLKKSELFIIVTQREMWPLHSTQHQSKQTPEGEQCESNLRPRRLKLISLTTKPPLL